MKLGEAKPQTRGDHARLEDLVDVLKLKNNTWTQIRLLDCDIISYKQHWINIMTSKTKREVRIPKICLAHDPVTEANEGECPYCEIESQGGVNYLVNVIVRSLQEDEPGKIRVTKAESASGFKDMASESWTPVRVMRLTSGLMKKIQELKALNKVKGKTGVKTFDVNDEKFGVDLNVKYDENAKGPEKYQINMAERTPMTEAESGYLIFELQEGIVDQLGREKLADAKKELGRMQIVGSEEFDGDDDDDETLGKKKKPAPSKKKPAKFDDDEDDEDEDDEDDEPAPKRGTAKKPAPAKKPVAKKKPVAEEDDDDFDDDEEEDDEPAPKRGAAKKPAPKKKPAVEDDDDDFDDEEDEDEEPAPKRGVAKKPVAKKKPAVEEDDDDDFDDEDEDDEPAPKRGAAKKPAPAKKPVAKKKPVVEDDEDEDDFDEDDEEDEPAPKRGAAKKPVAKKPAPSKKKPVVEDDDEDDEDEDEDDDEPF